MTFDGATFRSMSPATPRSRSGGQSRTIPAMPGRSRQRDPSRLKTTRLRLEPKLTRKELRKLEERAAADLRPVANYVAYLIAQDLQGKRRPNRPTSAKPGEKRTGYNLVVPITIPDRRELKERAEKELRSLSGYAARLIVEELGRVSMGC